MGAKWALRWVCVAGRKSGQPYHSLGHFLPRERGEESRMAWLEQHPTSGIYRITLRYGGRKINRSLKTCDFKDAEAALHRVEENIRLLERGRLILPDDADLA